MIIDTHAHYDDEAFDTDREALLMSMYDGGIEKIVNVCECLQSLFINCISLDNILFKDFVRPFTKFHPSIRFYPISNRNNHIQIIMLYLVNFTV